MPEPTLLRIRDLSKTPPHGFVWRDPITGDPPVTARNYSNWISLANERRIGNGLDMPVPEEMEDQLCRSYDDRTRAQVCIDTPGYTPKPGGPGTILKNLLAGLGINACWGCLDLAGKMDAWGPDGCEENKQYIVDAMQANADQKRWTRFVPFKELGSRGLVDLAIAKSRLFTSNT